MKKLLFLAVLAFGMNVTAQEKAGLGLTYSSENSISLDIVQSNKDGVTYGLGTSYFKNSKDINLAIYGNLGYDFKGIRVVSRIGSQNNGSLLAGGLVGINVTKRIIYNVGWDTRNKYQSGLTFILN